MLKHRMSYLYGVIRRVLALPGRLAPLVRAGLIAGVAIAAIAYPLAAISGLSAKRGLLEFDRLAAELSVRPPAETSSLYAADGKTLITMFYEEYRRYASIEDMSPLIQNAIVASEDARFYQHHGVDLRGIARAFVANRQAGEVSQGASTITMQYVRAMLRDSAQTPAEAQAATAQTSARKLREIRLALRVEEQMSKKDILERYLNVAYFGHRAYGVYAAAEVFFSKRPNDLTLVEAATLAGLVKAPSEYDPANQNKTAATQRRNYVIDRMTTMKYLSPADAEVAKKQPIKLKLTNPANDCVSVPRNTSQWGFFCDFFRSWWLSQPAFGGSPAEREFALRRGGYRIVTSLDPRLQASAQKHILEKVPVTNRYAHGLVAVEPGTGLVKAMAVNRIYSLDQSRNGSHSDPGRRGEVKGNYPNTVNPLLGGGDMPGYQAGSTFKMFTMLASLDAGMKLNQSFYAPRHYRSIYPAFDSPANCGGRWCPQNANARMTGRQTMWSGFGKSVNTYFVQLQQKVGAANAVHMAERLGLQWHTDIDKLQASPQKANGWGSFTLGVADTTPLEMANAYATVAADGRYCEPMPVVSITGFDGKPATYAANGGTRVEVTKPRCRPVVSPAVAQAAADAARCVTGYKAARGNCGDWSTASRVYEMVGRPVAGKTGTTDDTRAAWFVGITPDLAAASFIADPDNPFHVAGDQNSRKPVDSVAETLHDGLRDKSVHYFTPPPSDIVS
jgi:membrane peptidoglycan carboxypeptidase